MSFQCKDCEHAIITEVNCFYHGYTYATVDCECKDHVSKEERIRADERAIEKFSKPVIDGTLYTICKMIASGDIPKDIYNKWLSDTPIGFMTPLEIYEEILTEQLKEENK